MTSKVPKVVLQTIDEVLKPHGPDIVSRFKKLLENRIDNSLDEHDIEEIINELEGGDPD